MKKIFLLTMAFFMLLFACTKENTTLEEVAEKPNELRMIEEYYPSAEVDVKAEGITFIHFSTM